MASRRKISKTAARLESLESRVLFAVEVAETLLVNVDVTASPEGTANNVPNTGTLGGVFAATGGDDATPVIGRPVATATAGSQGIRLDGNDFLQLIDSVSGDLITAPAGITGTDPTRSIEVWVWNPSIPDEETMVSWGHRGGPDGSNMSFNYGASPDFGAVGHWGSPDAGWGPQTGTSVPAAKQWHHLVYTYDGSATRLYVDGTLLYTEALGPGVINTHVDTAINIGTQLEGDGVTPTGILRGNLTLSRVRIHDGVLTDAQVAANYNTEKGDFVPVVVPPPPPTPAELLVNVDATTLPEGPANDIPNTGPLGGVFEATGGEGTIPVIAPPLTSSPTGTRGIRLDGSDFLQLVTEPEGGIIPAPAEITGVDPKSSIETWVFNPNVTNEETMVSWGHRNGPDGSNMSFNYGNDNRWGAVGHWGSPDLGWVPTVPAAGQWHHLVYTFDGEVTRVYADGQLANSEDLGIGALNTHPDTAINLGTQLEANGFTPTPGLRGSLTLGRVRIYKGVLTDAQISTNFNNEKADFVNPTVTATSLTAPPIHRYSFGEAAGDATDVSVNDSIGDADGTVRGAGATFNGGQLVLPGGASDTAPYVDLPNGLLSSLGAANGGSGQVSFEGWVRHTGNQAWSRFYDFGATTAGELTEPGGTGLGSDFWMLTAQVGGDTGTHRLDITDNDDGDGTGNAFVDVASSTFNAPVHFVATWNETTGELKLYEQGKEVGAFTSTVLISAINDVNNWLGRSNFTPDANLQGDYDEFRIYNRTLSAGEVLGNFQAGPDVVTGGGSPQAPRVTEVFVSGSTWAAPFKQLLQTQGIGDSTFGYSLGSGAAALVELPWTSLNQVSIEFDSPVNVDQGDLTLSGLTVPSYAITGFAYDPSKRTATWTLGSNIGNDRLLIDLDADANGVTGVSGQVALNGEYNGTLPSGDATAGGDFRFRLNVLPTDTNQSGGAVNSSDLVVTRNRVGRSISLPGAGATAYSPFGDFNGDGVINSTDLVLVRNRVGTRLPSPPAASLFSGQRIAWSPTARDQNDEAEDLLA